MGIRTWFELWQLIAGIGDDWFTAKHKNNVLHKLVHPSYHYQIHLIGLYFVTCFNIFSCIKAQAIFHDPLY